MRVREEAAGSSGTPRTLEAASVDAAVVLGVVGPQPAQWHWAQRPGVWPVLRN